MSNSGTSASTNARKSALLAIQDYIEHGFRPKSILREAVQVPGHRDVPGQGYTYTSGNQRLASIGVSLIYQFLAEDVDWDEALMNDLPEPRSYVAQTWDVGATMDELDLDGAIKAINNAGAFPLQSEITQEIRITTVMAVLGAVFLSDCYGNAKQVCHLFVTKGEARMT